jgi:branched-chain amino acid transport system permease protein
VAYLTVALLNGLSYGLLLFMLSAGLTLVFSLMGVLNFAHAAFYMLGAYVGYSVSGAWGFWAALLLAPFLVGTLGAGFEHSVLRRVRPQGHVPELLVTFGLSYVLVELVQLAWGRAPLEFLPPELLRGAAFTLVEPVAGGWQWVAGAAPAALCGDGATCTRFPMTRAFTMVVALVVLAGLALLLARSRIGMLITAARTHPDMVECLGHDLPRIWRGVFGVGTGLAALAGVLGGSSFVTEPGMAAAVGSVVFVVIVVGGVGSLRGAFVASLGIGLLQTLAVAYDRSLLPLLSVLGLAQTEGQRLTLAQLAPLLPYALLVLMLAVRPQGLLGSTRG